MLQFKHRKNNVLLFTTSLLRQHRCNEEYISINYAKRAFCGKTI
jgi:hypothetical protein